MPILQFCFHRIAFLVTFLIAVACQRQLKEGIVGPDNLRDTVNLAGKLECGVTSYHISNEEAAKAGNEARLSYLKVLIQ